MVESRIVHPNIQLTDITAQFFNALKNLPSGQLIKDEHFTLFEAVGALEIGDPKMDSGCLEAEEGDDDEFDFPEPITERQTIWLIDELLCREAAWQSGYPLSQTLFTSVHIDRILWPDPKQLKDANFSRNQTGPAPSLLQELLLSYCLGLIKCCDLVLKMVTSQHYYEEEDFATQLFNREMLRRFSAKEVLDVMHQALDRFSRSDQQGKSSHALIIRLQYRFALLQMLDANATGTTVTNAQLDIQQSLLEEIEISASLGDVLLEAFSTRIQRRLASSVPPRPMITFGRKATFDFFRQFLDDAVTAFQVLEVHHSLDLMRAYWNFMLQVPAPSVYVRAVLQSFINLDEKVVGRYSQKDFIFQDLQMLVLPASLIINPGNDYVEAPSNPRFQIASHMNEFVTKLGQSYFNQFRTFCLNRSRVRRTLCHAAMEWDQLQADVEDLDGILQTLTGEQPRPYPAGGDLTYAYPLSSWIYHYKLTQLRLVVQLGFELSIYAANEFAQMYWYLSYICGIHLGHLDRISHFVSTATSSGVHPAENTKPDEVQATLHQLYRDFRWMKATESLAQALHRIYTLLQRHGHFTKISPAYASEELRFELRMRPYQHLSIPEPLQYEDMQKLSTLKHISDSDLLDQAAKLSLTAKKAWEEILKDGWNSLPLREQENPDNNNAGAKDSVIEKEWTKDVRNSMKACIGTNILISTLTKTVQNNKAGGDKGFRMLQLSIPPVGDRERFHSWWAVPKVVKQM